MNTHKLSILLTSNAVGKRLFLLALCLALASLGAHAAQSGHKPSAPTNCVATMFGYPPIDIITWNDNSNDEDGFTVEQWDWSHRQLISTIVVGPNTTMTSFYHYGYSRYRVRAFNAFGTSRWSNWATP